MPNAAVDTGRAVRRRYATSSAGYADDFDRDTDDFDGEDDPRVRTSTRAMGAVRLSFPGWMTPKPLWGRIVLGCAAAVVVGSVVAGMLAVRSFALRDEHFRVRDSGSIQIAGNSHLSRAQLLSVFGGDVERNIFAIPLAERRAELERLPWVGHATVMRLLPNRVRVAIVERTPVAFVRQGGEIGLVDASGVLFDLPSAANPEGDGAGAAQRYSFPVLSGIAATDPLSTRAARMKIYIDFVAALDAGGENVSHLLSEVDLSNPEDVRAVLPGFVQDANGGGAGILVHFGDERYLERYHRYQQHLPEWRTQYPRLSSVDMRYERQVVLEMQKGAEAATNVTAKPVAEASPASEIAKPASAKPATLKRKASPPPVSVRAAVKPAQAAIPAVGVSLPAASAVPAHHLTTAFAVTPKPASPKPVAKPATKAAGTAHPSPTEHASAGQGVAR